MFANVRTRVHLPPPTARSVVWPSSLPAAMLASSAFTAAGVLMRVMVSGALTVSPPSHHFMVLVAQHPGQEKRGFVGAPGFEASSRPAFTVNRDVPLALGAGSALSAAAPWWHRLLGGVVARCVGVVP